MKRLYLKIYLTIIVSLLLVVLVGGTIWRLGVDRSPLHETLETAAELVAAHLPPQTASREAQQRAITDLSRRLGADAPMYVERRCRRNADSDTRDVRSTRSSREPGVARSIKLL